MSYCQKKSLGRSCEALEFCTSSMQTNRFQFEHLSTGSGDLQNNVFHLFCLPSLESIKASFRRIVGSHLAAWNLEAMVYPGNIV